MTKSNFPPGWDERRVADVLAHDETQTDDEAVAEDEAEYENSTNTFMEVPFTLVAKVRELLAKET